MSSRTWTLAAVSSERRRMSGVCWRSVEAQHRVSTMKLVDTLDEQSLLESLIDQSKPPLPPECRHLHYLLATPFRYGAPYPSGSRFRPAGLTPGVFYASTTPLTAMVETAFHRLLFFADSPATPWPANPGEFTLFSVRFRTSAGVDLARPPFDADAGRWTHPTDYSACQSLADTARQALIDVVRYASARDGNGMNVALLSCRAFAVREPIDRQTWRLHFGPHGVRGLCDSPAATLALDREAFASDARIAALAWDR
jgi:hypothetical protein